MNCTTRYSLQEHITRLAITTEDLQIMLSCGRKSAVDVGELAEARIQIGRRVFWNVEKIKTYLNLISS